MKQKMDLFQKIIVVDPGKNGVKTLVCDREMNILEIFDFPSKVDKLSKINTTAKYNNTFNNITPCNNKKERKNTYDKIIDDRIADADLKGLIYEFIKMRKLKKKPLTDRALTIQLNKLLKIGANIEEQKQIVEASIVRCWDEFYPLKKEANDVPKNNRADGSEYAFLG